MILRVFQSLTFLEEILKDIFIFKKITIENTMNYLKTLIQLLIFVHLLAGAWIFINSERPDWDYYEIVKTTDDFYFSYSDSLYFMTTTMTAVGYGDRNGYGSSTLMLYVMVTQFIGILTFSLIKFNVFSAKT